MAASLTFVVKSFDELLIKELYDLLQLRSEVFVVEQDCVYQDLDGKDQKALHLLGYIGHELVAYTRIFGPGDYFKYASIGRVVVRKEQRQHKYGYQLMEQSIATVSTHFNVQTIKISAQTYLKKFYNTLGFKETGDTYLEDGIPHMAMIYQS